MKMIRDALMFLAGITAAMLVSVFAFTSTPAQVWPLPLDWVTDTFPQRVEVCPGDTVPYIISIWEKVEGPVALYATIDRGLDHPEVEAVRGTELAQALTSQYDGILVGDTVQIEKSPSWIILGGDDELRHYDNRLRVDIDAFVEIPDHLSAGPYIRKLAVVWEGRPSEAAIRVQRFTVKPKGECQ
jgi:hypothetical protein